jgi:hypothetical protein
LLLLSSAVTVKLPGVPAASDGGKSLTEKCDAAPATISVPVVGKLPFPWQFAPRAAVAVKEYVPGCVCPFVVEMVSVLTKSAVVIVTVSGRLNEAVAPVVIGVGDALNVTSHAALFPACETVAV